MVGHLRILRGIEQRDDVDMAENRMNVIVEVVGDSAGEEAERFDSLGVCELF